MHFPLKHLKLKKANKLGQECSSASTVSHTSAAEQAFGAWSEVFQML